MASDEGWKWTRSDGSGLCAEGKLPAESCWIADKMILARMAANHGWLLDGLTTNAEEIAEGNLILRTTLSPPGPPLN